VPLPHYGVVIGTLESFTRDPQHDFGAWYHGHVTLATSGGTWQSALDVDAPQSVGVSYRVVEGLHSSDLGPVAGLGDGFHALAASPTSGALDYVRSPILRDGPLVHLVRRTLGRPAQPSDGRPRFGPDRADRLLARIPWSSSQPWISSNGDNALDALAPLLTAATRIHLFGERYEDGTNGVHDVHDNQGDPAGSQWYAGDGIWQDGGVACQSPGDNVAIWQVRFNTQSLDTDNQGHPAGTP
jgi:hypothetical protein